METETESGNGRHCNRYIVQASKTTISIGARTASLGLHGSI